MKKQLTLLCALFIATLVIARSHNKQTKLHKAIRQSNIATVKQLLAKGANINAKGRWGRTPLILAAQLRRTKIAQLLIEKGADLNITCNAKKSALFWAARWRRNRLAKLLIQKGAAADRPGRSRDRAKKECTPLTMALDSNNKELAKLLLTSGAAIHIKNSAGNTPLILAADNGHLEIVRLLLAKKAKINVKGSSQRTAFWKAITSKHFQIAELLLKHGADINTQDCYGQTALASAVKRDKPREVRFLLKRGARANTKTKKGETPLLIAIQKNNRTLPILLQSKNLGLDLQDSDGKTALILATQKGRYTLVETLLNKGANISIKDYFMMNALTWAIKKKHTKIEALLRKKGATISKADIRAMRDNLSPPALYKCNIFMLRKYFPGAVRTMPMMSLLTEKYLLFRLQKTNRYKVFNIFNIKNIRKHPKNPRFAIITTRAGHHHKVHIQKHLSNINNTRVKRLSLMATLNNPLTTYMSFGAIKLCCQPKGVGKLQLLRCFLHSHQVDKMTHRQFNFHNILFRPLRYFTPLFYNNGQSGFWNYRKTADDKDLSTEVENILGTKLIFKKSVFQTSKEPSWMKKRRIPWSYKYLMEKTTSHLNYYNPEALLRLFLLLYIPPHEKVLGFRVSTLYSLAQKNIKDQINLLVSHLLHKKLIYKIAKQFNNDLENGTSSWRSLLALSNNYFPFSLKKELSQYLSGNLAFPEVIKDPNKWPIQYSETLFFKGLILRRANDHTLETIIDILGTFLYHYDRSFFKTFKHKLSSKGYNVSLLFRNWKQFSREPITKK